MSEFPQIDQQTLSRDLSDLVEKMRKELDERTAFYAHKGFLNTPMYALTVSNLFRSAYHAAGMIVCLELKKVFQQASHVPESKCLEIVAFGVEQMDERVGAKLNALVNESKELASMQAYFGTMADSLSASRRLAWREIRDYIRLLWEEDQRAFHGSGPTSES